MNKNNIIVLVIALVAILISTLTKCDRNNVTPEQVELQKAKVDSLKNVLDSLNNLKPDTLTIYETEYKTRYVTKVVTDTFYKEFGPRTLSTSFVKDEVEIGIEITVENSEVKEFDYTIDNMRNAQTNQTYIDTAYVVQYQTVYDTISVQTSVQSGLQLYQPRHFNVGFAVVADPTLSKLAPGLSLSYKQHELIGYYNVLDQASQDRLGLMYRFNFWNNYRLQKVEENEDKKNN